MENETGELLTVREIAELTGLHRSEVYTIMLKAKITFESESPKMATITTFLKAFQCVVNVLHSGNRIKRQQLNNALEDIKDYNSVIRKFSLNIPEI